MSEDLISIDIYPDIAHGENLTPICGVEIDDSVEQIYSACKGWYQEIPFQILSILRYPPELKISEQ